MSTQPKRPGTDEDAETEKIVLARLAAFEKDKKTLDPREAIARLQQKLKHAEPR